MCENDLYILYFDRAIGSKIKPEKYFAQWKRGEWHVALLSNGMFSRMRLALRFRKKLISTYQFFEHASDYIEIKLPFSLPKEENMLLRLIAMSNENKWPKSYFTTVSQLNNVRDILAHCKLTEVGATNNGIYD